MTSTRTIPNSLTLQFLIFLSILISCVESSNQSTSTTAMDNGDFRLRLIDSDSPLSPFYDPNRTIYDRSTALIHRSITRLHHLQSSIKSPDYLIAAPLTSEDLDYIVNFWAGTPPSEITAILDTGSKITWFQCLPCEKCFNQTKPIFDPSKSSSYRDLTCISGPCQQLSSTSCESGLCKYGATYGDGSFSDGSLAIETFTFNTADRRSTSLLGVVFGCGHKNGGRLYKNDLAGIVSMGQGPLSLINQLNQRRFSYCLVPRGATMVSHLQIGITPLLAGKTTPFFQVEGSEHLYYLSLDDISLGSEPLHIPLKAFKPSKYQGLIIDTGTSIDILDSSGFDLVIRAVQRVMKLKEVTDPHQELELCYEGTMGDLVGFPSLTYHFVNGADLVVGSKNLFQQVADRVVCLSMLRNDDSISIIGSKSQENYIVGYDFHTKLISFGPYDCSQF
ncbi:Peptidase A1 [Macleaya cordata]|uniref:Peptidase A1 n=1 Tax=Macleaya cordata TaxID=56857 RepID=A0A200QX48_MACCD|nr:Peptidase A1 [Macleaya cordata]